MFIRQTHHRFPSGFVLIELLTVIMVIFVLIALLLPAVQQAREAARRTSCKNNMIQIGVALQNYQMAHRVLPPGTVNSQGPILTQPKGYHVSWVLQILPFLDEKAAYLSHDFKLGVYASKNIKTANYRLSCFQCPSNSLGGYNYVGCHHDIEAPIDVDNNGVFFLNSCIREKDIKDGRSYTFFVGEAMDGGFLSWTSGTSSTLRNMGIKINDVDPNQTTMNQANRYGTRYQDRFEQNDSDEMFEDPDSSPDQLDDKTEKLTPEQRKRLLEVGGFSSAHTNGAHFSLGDGSVRFISDNTDFRILKNLANRHDNNLIGEY